MFCPIYSCISTKIYVGNHNTLHIRKEKELEIKRKGDSIEWIERKWKENNMIVYCENNVWIELYRKECWNSGTEAFIEEISNVKILYLSYKSIYSMALK